MKADANWGASVDAPAIRPAAMQVELDLREALCRVGGSLSSRGYVHATAGNLSARLADGYLITPTDACLGTLDPARLSRVDADGRLLAGDVPSKTLTLHRRIYAGAPLAGCVLHTHSTHLVALSLQGVWRQDAILPPLTPYFVMKVGAVPLIPYHRPGDPVVADLVAAAMAAAEARGAPLRAVMLDRLGPVVWERCPQRAAGVLEELEETARLWGMCRRPTAPEPGPLDEGQIEALRLHLGAVWPRRDEVS